MNGHQVVSRVCQQQTNTHCAALVAWEQQHAITVVKVVCKEDVAVFTTTVVAPQERADVAGTSDGVGLESELKRSQIQWNFGTVPRGFSGVGDAAIRGLLGLQLHYVSVWSQNLVHEVAQGLSTTEAARRSGVVDESPARLATDTVERELSRLLMNRRRFGLRGPETTVDQE